MADLVLLPASIYRPPPPQAQRRGRAGTFTLNPIIEEVNEEREAMAAERVSGRLSRNQTSSAFPTSTSNSTPATALASALSLPSTSRSNDKIEQWLSPMSDHFPTPRGLHFLTAPVLPATPSCLETASETETESEGEGEGGSESIDDVSSVSSASQPSSSNMWNRQSVMTDVTEFDIYDVSGDEQDQAGTNRKSMLQANGIGRQRGSRGSRSATIRGSSTLTRPSMDSQKLCLAPLVIPATHDEDMGGLKKKMLSPVPPTPPTKVDMSPAVKSFMAAHQSLAVPTISAPPSLDGSLNSEELAVMSAPPTPSMSAADDGEANWVGVRLQPGALETLQALSGSEADLEMENQREREREQEQVMEVPQEMSEMRQQPARLMTHLSQGPFATRKRSAAERTLAGLTKLDIPSPGGFFSDLSSATRRTWQPGLGKDDLAPPTSTTAEQFYKTPWAGESLTPPMPSSSSSSSSSSSASPPPPMSLSTPLTRAAPIVEQVVEIPSTVNLQDLPTAIRIQPTPEPITARRVPLNQPQSALSPPFLPPPAPREPPPFSPFEANEIVMDPRAESGPADAGEGISQFDRTQLWLMAQRNYMQGIAGFSDDHEKTQVTEEEERERERELQVQAQRKHQETLDKLEDEKEEEARPPVPEKDSAATLQAKKTVRFSEFVLQEPVSKRLPNKLARQESAYYRAFTDATVRCHQTDAFVAKQARFEALQASRVALGETHRSHLLGKFQLSVVPQSAKKRMSANVARGDDELVDDPDKLRADKEAEALGQMSMAMWHVAATKLLNGGRLMAAPVAKRLVRQSYMQNGAEGVERDRTRILDLAGVGTCDWAWHAALQFPNTKIYTVTTKAIRQLSNSNIRGPPNHRQVAVERLTKLPFANDQFDLVSGRELHAALRVAGEHGVDEWEACLAECMRVLKPGGFLEFSVLDADIMNAGPLGNAKAVEFGFALQTLGFDPSPTRTFVGRLQHAGFEDVRRAWMCLPVGPKPRSPLAVRGSRTIELEAMVSGSADHAAAVTGFAAGWSWERWMLRAEMEKAAGELRLADIATTDSGPMREASKMIANVHSVIEEGRATGSAFRLLRGYARKPRIPVATAPAVAAKACDLGRMGTIKISLC